MTATGFLPPRCGAVVGRGWIPSSSGRLWPCCSSLQTKQSGRPLSPVGSAGQAGEVECLYPPGPKKDIPRQHRVAEKANPINRPCRTDSERRRIPLTPPATLSTLQGQGRTGSICCLPPPQGTSQTTRRLYKLSSPAFRFNPVNISPAVAKLNGIKIWKQSPYPVGELQERRFPGTTRVPTNSSE